MINYYQTSKEEQHNFFHSRENLLKFITFFHFSSNVTLLIPQIRRISRTTSGYWSIMKRLRTRFSKVDQIFSVLITKSINDTDQCYLMK